MADYGVDEGGFPLSSLEAAGMISPRRQRLMAQADFNDLFPIGEELERRRAALKAACIKLGWEFVEAANQERRS